MARIGAAILLSAVLFGCSSSTPAPQDASQDGPLLDGPLMDSVPPPAEGTVDLLSQREDVTPPLATVGGRFLWHSTKKPVVGADVCVYIDGAKGDCVKTDSYGIFAIFAPMEKELAILGKAEDMAASAFPLYIEETLVDLGTWDKLTVAEMAALCAPVGATYPSTTTGSLSINGTTGAKISLPSSAGSGPFYVDASFQFDTTMTEMGAVPFGAILDLAPGVYDVQLTHATLACTSTLGWPSEAATFRGPAIAGYATVLMASCK